MAEKACHDGPTRRQSFRTSLLDARLPDSDLERLELKRRQLDDSIHKYIASKEREYKSLERELIQSHKLAQDREHPKQSSRTTPPWGESTRHPTQATRAPDKQQTAIDALLSAGLRRDSLVRTGSSAVVDEEDGSAPTGNIIKSMAGLTDRKASMEREKDFLGLFTPPFLPALVHGRRSSSPGPSSSAPPPGDTPEASVPDGVQRTLSDSIVHIHATRPPQLQLVNRTSSSGSSENGSGTGGSKLLSALKSPTHPRPKRKRVSLAVGNAIVAPSDNVPLALGNNHAPSHSRPRSRSPNAKPRNVTGSASLPEEHAPGKREATQVAALPRWEATVTSLPRQSPAALAHDPGATGSPSATFSAPSSETVSKAAVDGDLEFGLDETEILSSGGSSASLQEGGEDGSAGPVGRVTVSSAEDEGPMEEFGEEAEPGRAREAELEPEPSDDDDDGGHAEHIEFHPSSIQHTRTPGFRRPSATMDPIYTGPNYERAERSAVTNEIYGSSFYRPTSKGSFTPGSMGESFMAQNAERITRERAPGASRAPTQVR